MQGTSSSGSDKIIPDTRDYFRWLPCRLICLYSEMICCEEYFWLLGGLFLFFFLFCFVFVVLLFGFDFLKFYFIILFTGTNKIYITIYIWRKFCFTLFFFLLIQNHKFKSFFKAASFKAFLCHHKEFCIVMMHRWVWINALFKQQWSILPFLVESQMNLGRRRPAVNLALPNTPLNHVSKHQILTYFKYFRGRWIKHSLFQSS